MKAPMLKIPFKMGQRLVILKMNNMNLQEQINRIHEMMGVISEDISPNVKRRIKFGDIDKLVNKIKVASFKKNKPVEDSVRAAIISLFYELIPDDFDGDDEGYYKVKSEIKAYLNDNYGEELKQYFEKRQKDAEQEKGDVKYLFVKHNKPYYDMGWAGFQESFDSFSDLVTKYGDWVDIDWDGVKQKLDTINDYPENTFTGSMNSRPLRISSIGDDGNDWGYNFSIIKQVSKDDLNESKVNIKESKLSMGIQKIVNNSLEELRAQAEDWGLGEMDDIDEIESIDDIVVANVIMDDEPVVYLDFRVNSNRRDFDNVRYEIAYGISKYLPNSKIIVNIVDTRTFGPGIDW